MAIDGCTIACCLGFLDGLDLFLVGEPGNLRLQRRAEPQEVKVVRRRKRLQALCASAAS